MAAWILQFTLGDIPPPPFPFEPATHASKVKWLLAVAVLLYVWSLIRLVRTRGK
jgi:hypothetical protein